MFCVKILARLFFVVLLLSSSCLFADQRTDQIFNDLDTGKVMVGKPYQQPCPTVITNERSKAWRFSGIWVHPLDSDTRDVVGDGWGAELEYSLGNPYSNFCNPVDFSLAASYRFTSNDDDTYPSNEVDFKPSTLMAKTRYGAGAKPGCDGGYIGVGLGIARLAVDVDYEGYSLSDSTYKFVWSVFTGANFADTWFIEATYLKPSDWYDNDFSMFTAGLGVRF